MCAPTLIRHRIFKRSSSRVRPAALLILAGQRGSLLIGLIVTMSIIAVAGAAMVSLIATSTYSELAAGRYAAAYYMAESGGRYAIPQIIDDVDQAIAELHGKTYTFSGGQQFSLAIDNSADDYVYLFSTGVANRDTWSEARTTITYRFPKTMESLFDRGAFGYDKVTVDHHAYVDSYQGTWTGEGDGYDPDNPIDLVGTNGDEISGGNCRHHEPVIYGTILLNEGRDQEPETPPTTGYVPLVVNGTIYGPNDTLDFGSQGSITISGGAYQLNKLYVHNNSALHISGDVVLYVEDFSINNSTTVTLAENSSLTVYFSNTFKLDDDSQINGQGTPANVAVYGTDTAAAVEISHNSILSGAVYAPTASIQVHTSTVFGSLIGEQVDIGKHQQCQHADAAVHYDEGLLTSTRFSRVTSIGDPGQYF